MWRRLTGKYYVKGYLDGYTDAETEYLENSDYAITAYNNGYVDGITDNSKILHYKTSQEDLDVAYWQGYNNAITEMYMNEDSFKMSTNEDGWYTDGTTYMTQEHIENRWHELFDANPWLEGMTHAESCEFIDCCPVPDPQDWLVFNEVFTLIFLAGLHSPHTLTRDLMDNLGGMQ